MYRIALKMIYDGDTACDIIHDIFIYYHKQLENGRNINKTDSWLIRATINKCIDHSKYRKRHEKIDSIEHMPSTENAVENNQDEELVIKALSKLKPKERTLALLYSEGMSYKEISEISGIKLSSVGKMLSRTLDKLGVILKKMNYDLY